MFSWSFGIEILIVSISNVNEPVLHRSQVISSKLAILTLKLEAGLLSFFILGMEMCSVE